MINRRLATTLLLLAIPALAPAQRRTRGEPEANWDAITKTSKSSLRLSNKDVENMSPIKMLIDEKKDLKLTDAQLTQLKDLDRQLKDKNQDFFRRLDSLRTAMKPDANPSDTDRANMANARREVLSVVKGIGANYDAAVKEIQPCLDETQQKLAAEKLAALASESEKELRSKVGGGDA